MMNRNDFETIAAILKDGNASQPLIVRFAEYFSTVNPRFDTEKFFNAAGYYR